MEAAHVCIVDAEGRKVDAQCVESTPAAIAGALERGGPIARAVIETGRMTPSIALGLREERRDRLHRRTTGTPGLKAMKANKSAEHRLNGSDTLIARHLRLVHRNGIVDR